jgi:hypothetical protein
VSTIVTAYALESLGQGEVISLEHDAIYASITSRWITQHALESYASVVHAPLERVRIGCDHWLWYDVEKAKRLAKPIDLLVVDGPPGNTMALARFPALPLLAPLLSERAIIFLDDFCREHEKEIVDRWLHDFPEFSATSLRLEKGGCLLHRGRDRVAPIAAASHAA